MFRPPNPAGNSGPAQRVRRALLVEDDAATARVLARMLRAVGVAEVQHAADGAVGIGALESAERPFDIAFCDLNMPGEDGLVFLRRLASLAHQPAVVLMSGGDPLVLDAAERLARGHGLCVLGVAPKPLTPSTVTLLVERLHDAGRQARATVASPRPVLTPQDVERAMSEGRFEVWFQPQAHLASGLILGAEALLRLRHETSGIITAGAFMASAEKSNVIGRLTSLVLDRAAACSREIQARTGRPFRVAVNLSAATLSDVSHPDALTRVVREHGLSPSSVTFELTESMLAANEVATLEVVSRLRLAGFRLSIDDFGTGYASLDRLRQLPFHELKLDQTFVKGALHDRRSRLILENSLALATALRLSSVAEGVELQEQLDLVSSLGCELAQGYLIARPMPADALLATMADGAPARRSFRGGRRQAKAIWKYSAGSRRAHP